MRLNESLEQRVRERTAELEAFSYSVSHDLRAPLRTIDGFSQVLLEDYKDKLDDEGKSNLARIRRAAINMSNLIEDMLKLYKISRTEMDIGPVNLSTIARSITDELHHTQPERHAEFIIADNLEALADPGLIRVVFENLFGNAWKFTGKQEKTEIEFGLTTKDNQNVYFIRDNGAGFDMENAGKLFAPFQRLHSIEEYSGTGIGLAIVKRIINRHGGRIWAEAQPGKGATFYFTLQE
jgi:light-regulated signal transduction histidine kinase (bacteriophytochrome)